MTKAQVTTNEANDARGMVLNHRQPRTHTFKFREIPVIQNGKPVVRVSAKTGEKIPQTKPDRPVDIYPGINFLSGEQYQKLMADPSTFTFYTLRVRANKFEEVCRADNLGDVPEDKVLYVISNTVDLDLLEEWFSKYGERLGLDNFRALELQILKLKDPGQFQKTENARRLQESSRMGRAKVRDYKRVSEISPKTTGEYEV